jgi:uncharacterized protein YqeY
MDELQTQIARELQEAMKSRDSVRVSTLRLLIAAFRNKEIALQKTLTGAELLDVIQAEGKRRRESIEEYSKANRPDLADKEKAELAVLQIYLPQPLSEAEIRGLAEKAVASSGAKGPQDMGRVMSALMPMIKGRADGKQAQQIVVQLLSARS